MNVNMLQHKSQSEHKHAQINQERKFGTEWLKETEGGNQD